MFRKPIVWIAFVVLAAACAAYSYHEFPRAFSLVNLDLQMDRQGALEAARRLAVEHGWGPAEFRQAASFEVDDDVRSFVELEAGGRDAYIEMLRGELYSPYTWQVRHFRPGETNETQIRFTPSGAAYGFTERLAEEEPGAALDADEAQRVAEEAAAAWEIALDGYERVERRQDVRTGGRIDHTLVYERTGVAIGEGRYRLRLVVGGDRLIELTHFVKIPEAFERRFQEMRSANEIIASLAFLAMGLAFLGGGLVGLFVLLRERWVVWKPALVWGSVVSLGMGALTVNQWPLAWVGYDTAVSETNFLLTRLASLLGQLVGLALLYVASFMAAECLTRRAFPGQIQLWRSWGPQAAPTPAMLGRTLSGYLLVPVDLAFLILFYTFAFEKLGWWSPSEALLDPNILATPFPWLSSIAISLQAGFWEECMFRAVPLAGAALLGRRFGGTRWWILGALVAQALVFGAGHANYPGHPSYARLVELFLPAVFWGVIYLLYGLIPVIILHATFDVLLISLPLWVSSAPGLWDDRVLVVLLTLLPLWVVLAARWRHGRWRPVDPQALNGAWTPPPPAVRPPAAAPAEQEGLAAGRLRLVFALGAAGLAAWLALAKAPADAPPLPVTRTTALEVASAALEARGWSPPAGYRPLTAVEAGVGQPHRYVWQEGDEETYRRLLGRYLPAPRWYVRYAAFEGDVAARAEEFEAWVDASGKVTRMRHQLPEAAEGADLPEAEARARARAAIRERTDLDPARLEEVQASPAKEANRTDWTFELADREALSLAGAEPRVGVVIAGDEVADVYRYLHVPEDWERADRNRATLARTIQVSFLVLMFGIFLAGGVIAIVRWSRGRFGLRVFLGFALTLAAVRVTAFLILWPRAQAEFDTAWPYSFQAAGFLIFTPLFALVSAVVLGLNVGLADRWRAAPPGAGSGSFVAGLALGAAAAGAAAAIAAFVPRPAPSWPEYTAAGSLLPPLSAALGPLSSFATLATLLLLAMAAAGRWTAGWTRRRGIVSAGLIALGFLLVAVEGMESLPAWLAAGALLGLAVWGAYVLFLRFDLRLLPGTVAALSILGAVRQGLAGAFPGALPASLVAAALIAAAAWLWQRSLSAPPSP